MPWMRRVTKSVSRNEIIPGMPQVEMEGTKREQKSKVLDFREISNPAVPKIHAVVKEEQKIIEDEDEG